MSGVLSSLSRCVECVREFESACERTSNKVQRTTSSPALIDLHLLLLQLIVLLDLADVQLARGVKVSVRVIDRVALADAVALCDALARVLDLEQARAREVVVVLLRRADDLLLVCRVEAVGRRERGGEIRLGKVAEWASVRLALLGCVAVDDLDAARGEWVSGGPEERGTTRAHFFGLYALREPSSP